MDLDVTLPRFAGALADGAMLAVLDGDAPVDAPWEREETAFMIDFLEARGERRRGSRKSIMKSVSSRSYGASMGASPSSTASIAPSASAPAKRGRVLSRSIQWILDAATISP